MCDYSLQHVASRPAKVGDELVSTKFHNSITRGFANAEEVIGASEARQRPVGRGVQTVNRVVVEKVPHLTVIHREISNMACVDVRVRIGCLLSVVANVAQLESDSVAARNQHAVLVVVEEY